jgi:hypothetical protein
LSPTLLASDFAGLHVSVFLNLRCGGHVCLKFCPYIPHFICFLDYVQHDLGFGFRGTNLMGTTMDSGLFEEQTT